MNGKSQGVMIFQGRKARRVMLYNDRVHKIYEDTVWSDKPDGQGFSGMGFIIKKIVVHR